MTKLYNAALIVLLWFVFAEANAQQSPLTVEKIMQDPQWMGTFPSRVQWGAQGEKIYFQYNLDGSPSDSLYKVNMDDLQKIEKVTIAEKKAMPPTYGDYNADGTQLLYTDGDALMVYDIKKDESQEILNLGSRIGDAAFMGKDKVGFSFEDNAYVLDIDDGAIHKLTNIVAGEAKVEKPEKTSTKDSWLKSENLQLLQVVREREKDDSLAQKYRSAMSDKEPYKFYKGEKSINNFRISATQDYVTFNLVTRERGTSTEVPNYVDASGYTRELRARSKVGDDNTQVELAIYDIKKDTAYMVKTDMLPGIKDLPDYVKDYPDKTWEKVEREVILSSADFSPKGDKAIVNVRSKDNKDRWIALMDLTDGSLKSLDRQRDEAWIAGPGIGWSFGGGTLGWLDNSTIYFQSETSGYSHLYLLDVATGKKTDLTPGDYEVFDPFLSKDKKSWFLTTSQEGPGERHFYKMPATGGKMIKLTTMVGNNDVSLSPDEKYMAILYSYSNKPWELYLKKTSASAKATQITHGQSEAFRAYDWREPELIHFRAGDGAMVPARLYVPDDAAKNNAAVVFVHGAGYLQNVHKWWSSYFREYMFNNMLTDLGYTVIDIDYRGSAGYGRDWRTAIYRHMGGKDLSDQVDGVKYLIENYDIDPEKVGLYGGSYGGFITLMAMFNAPSTFKAGGALRSVTDWAHYNHGYTANILNEPYNDPIAYERSSPIYFAEGLKGDLLIAHGMVDTNVHFQDVVRLAQRLIELGKKNWEMAVFPVEDHGFVEPSSWTDEYSRILKLFNESLLGK
ncbi:MAG: S9 family peptidase [Cytophagaceae bacterium]|nr:S9 family peptidase [Cytophagaceae bacterium]|tara:strand:+ start:1064 stop:3430 length:2367 start_codon:yes stop_codon:yes gene_type:complete